MEHITAAQCRDNKNNNINDQLQVKEVVMFVQLLKLKMHVLHLHHFREQKSLILKHSQSLRIRLHPTSLETA